MVLTILLRARKEKTGRDGTMFKTALEVIDTVPNPFFGMLITMSMHTPFVDENVSQPKWISDIPSVSISMKNYLTVSNYFDTCLGEFIDSLKEKGLYDDTVIAIASDHNVVVEGSGYDHDYTKIVFCILNSGITLHSSTPMGQVDVFSTLLQVMDKYDKNYYCGMGLSMFNPELKGAIDKNSRIHGDSLSVPFKKMLEISGKASNLILRSNSHY